MLRQMQNSMKKGGAKIVCFCVFVLIWGSGGLLEAASKTVPHKKAEIEARKLMIFGRLLGGAGGSGEVCLSLPILQRMVSGPNHALLPLRGCGES